MILRKKFPDSEYLEEVIEIQSDAKENLEDHYALKAQYEARTAEALKRREEEQKNQEATEALKEAGN